MRCYQWHLEPAGILFMWSIQSSSYFVYCLGWLSIWLTGCLPLDYSLQPIVPHGMRTRSLKISMCNNWWKSIFKGHFALSLGIYTNLVCYPLTPTIIWLLSEMGMDTINIHSRVKWLCSKQVLLLAALPIGSHGNTTKTLLPVFKKPAHTCKLWCKRYQTSWDDHELYYVEFRKPLPSYCVTIPRKPHFKGSDVHLGLMW